MESIESTHIMIGRPELNNLTTPSLHSIIAALLSQGSAGASRSAPSLKQHHVQHPEFRHGTMTSELCHLTQIFKLYGRFADISPKMSFQ